jgi:hypothetical protein
LAASAHCVNDELGQHYRPVLIRLQGADDDLGAHLHRVAVQLDASAQKVDVANA